MPVRRIFLLLLLSAFTAFAQESAQPASATLTGHVICADSNAPARFAKVLLKSATPSKSNDDFLGVLEAANKARNSKGPQLSQEDAAAQKAQQAAAAKMFATLSDLVPSPATFTLKTDDAADATTTSTKHMLGSTIAEQKTQHAYGSASTTVQLNSSDLDDLTLSVPETSISTASPKPVKLGIS